MPSPLSDLYEALLAAVDSAFAGDRSAAAPESSGRARRWPWLPQIPYLNPAPPPPPASRLPRSFEECLRLCREKPETAAAGGAAAAALLAAIAALPRGLRRYRDVGDMTNDVFRRKTKITGIVTSVGDGDNFRLYHRPWAHRVLRLSVPSEARALQNETIHIRLAGIDAPEAAHFGMPAQPFSAESKDFLKSLIFGKTVTAKLLSRDRYNRAVAMAYAPIVKRLPFPRRNVSLVMARQGFARVYEGEGAEYDGIKEKLVAAEASAKKGTKNVWSQRARDHISPGEHKKIHLRGGT